MKIRVQVQERWQDDEPITVEEDYVVDAPEDIKDSVAKFAASALVRDFPKDPSGYVHVGCVLVSYV